MLLLTVVVVVLCVLHVGAFVELSPVDEMMHFDNLVRTSSPDLVPDSSAPLDQATLRELACRAEHDDAWQIAPPGAACLRNPQDPADYWWRGLNPSIGHVPLYYGTTGVASRFLRLVVPSFGILTWARLLGALWAVTGCWFAMRAAASLGVSRAHTAASLALVLAVPSQLTAMTMVNPDAALFAVGGALLLLVVKISKGSVSQWWLVPATVAAMLVDPSASIALVFAVTFLAVDALARPGPRVGSLMRIAPTIAVTTLAAATTLFAWGALVAAASDVGDFSGSPQDGLYRVEELPLSKVVGSGPLLALLPPTDQPHEPGALREPARALFVDLTKLLLVAGSMGAVLRGRGRLVPVACAALVALMVAAPLMVLRNFLVNHWYFEIPNRYGISALPVLAVLLAGAVTGPIGRGILAVVVGGLVTTTLLALT